VAKVLSIEGRAVVDAKKPVSIEIVPNDIAKASRKDPNDCVIARACRRSMHAHEVRIHLSRVYVRRTSNSQWERYLLPPRAKQEIIAFDRGGSFEPISFDLYAPTPSHKLGARTGGEDGPKKARQLKRKAYRHVQNVRVGPASYSA